MNLVMDDYPGFHERMCRLREMEIGLDGAICAGGGEVRVHLPYMAACNQTLFNRITGLLKQGKAELNARNVSLKGTQLIVEFCYTGLIEITEDTFENIIDAALGLEFLNVVEQCVQFAMEPNINANIWCHFLRAAFKHPRSVQPNNFVPDLILHNITKIPRRTIMKALDVAYIAEILEHGTVDDKDRCYAINLFLEMMLSEMSDIKNYAGAIRRMKDLVRPGDNLFIPKDSSVAYTMSLMELSLHIGFSALVEACVDNFETSPLSATVISQILMWIKQYSESESESYLNKICMNALVNLPMDISEDDLCSLLQNNGLGKISEFNIFKIVLNWINQNNSSVSTKRKVIGLVRFGLMKKDEIDDIFINFPVQGCEEIFYSAMRYHMRLYDKPLSVGGTNQMRLSNPLVYVMGGKDGGNNLIKNVFFSEASLNQGKLILSPFTKACKTPFSLFSSACAEMNGFLFVCGGQRSSGSVSTFFRFDSRTDTWLELAQMGQKRYNHTLTTMGGCIIAVGGRDGRDILDSVESYAVKNNSWTVIKTLAERRSQHAASYVDGCLYVSGGAHSNTLFEFCDGVWTAKSPMLNVRQGHAMTGVSGTLVAVGGAGYSNGKLEDIMSTECYDIIQDQWTELAPSRLACHVGCFIRVRNWLYILGGYSHSANTTMDEIQKYDIESNKWELCKIQLPHAMCRNVGAYISNK